ncbi:MAG: tryptophan synthase subunit beta [Actinomycetaceae bacterium]|nr:tryptophan synthase subunit beta [Actinomycetaceae bacterium]
MKDTEKSLASQSGPYFGEFGGQFLPEALMEAVDDLTQEWLRLKDDPSFQSELDRLHRTYSGRPSIITEVPKFSRHCGNARVILKREDLNHTGSHKINNVIGQALLTKSVGKTRVIAETGAGQHGVASATAAALLGLDCTIYMGAKDVERQSLNVARMELLGADVVSVTTGSQTLKDAINEAFRDWVTNVETTNYLFGTAAGPHPYPSLVRDFQKIIGEEARAQVLDLTGRLPDYAIACVGGGSNAICLFNAILDDEYFALFGCEAGGEGVESGKTAASINAGSLGVFQGAVSYILQDDDGQTLESHSISAGLDYPGLGPEHCWLSDIGRATYIPINDDEAMEAFRLLTQEEGIIPAIESSHALAGAIRIGKKAEENEEEPPIILVNLSGRGDKDVQTAMKWFGIEGKGRTL